MRRHAREAGFTIAELLVVLLILGQIATFTIPKVLTSQQNGANKAKAKEAAAMLAAAYNTYRLQNNPTSTTTMSNLTPYMNYVKVDTTTLVDDAAPYDSVSCGAVNHECLVLHSGAYLVYEKTRSFNGTGALNAISFGFDPDGQYTGNSSGKTVAFFIYFNGRMTSWATITPNTVNSTATWQPDPAHDPLGSTGIREIPASG